MRKQILQMLRLTVQLLSVSLLSRINEVLFYVNGWEDLTNLAPTFKLTEGAKIEPESGTKLNFTQPQAIQ